MSRTGSGRTRNDRAMKVGLVSPYDFASPGGVNDHVRHLAVQLQQLGHETRIFAPSSRADVDFDSARFYRIGTPIAIPVNDSVARITLSFHLANQVAAIVADEGFDVLHFHEPLMPALPITIDGAPFEGGTGEDIAVVIGSNSFIPGSRQEVRPTPARASGEPARISRRISGSPMPAWI